MFKFIKKLPYWYLIAIPLLLTFMGAASNQAVLIANGDKFPVLVNNERIEEMCKPPQPKEDNFLASLLPSLKLGTLAQPAYIDKQACSAGGDFFDGDSIHVIMKADSRLKFMADIFDFHGDIYSIGDGLIGIGDWMLSWAPLAWLVLVIRKFIEA
jgi:hypothetical protein